MANREHLALLKAGAVQWIEWRQQNPPRSQLKQSRFKSCFTRARQP
jgi:hypothetical protein